MMRPTKFFAFLIFFPILPVGPIECVKNLGLQLIKQRQWRPSHFTSGVLLIALGVFKKVVIADHLSELTKDSGHDSLVYHGYGMWAFVLLSLLQISAGFSSIDDIARGVGRLLGLNIVDNFNRPYLAESVQDNWQRRHISLVSWLRDFIYAPIAIRTRSVVIAPAVVMRLIGMWHELSWRFGLWSLYWLSLFWIAVPLRRRGLQMKVGRLLRRLAMISAMAVSTVFMLPASLSELATLVGNFFQFTGDGSKDLMYLLLSCSVRLSALSSS